MIWDERNNGGKLDVNEKENKNGIGDLDQYLQFGSEKCRKEMENL